MLHPVDSHVLPAPHSGKSKFERESALYKETERGTYWREMPNAKYICYEMLSIEHGARNWNAIRCTVISSR